MRKSIDSISNATDHPSEDHLSKHVGRNHIVNMFNQEGRLLSVPEVIKILEYKKYCDHFHKKFGYKVTSILVNLSKIKLNENNIFKTCARIILLKFTRSLFELDLYKLKNLDLYRLKQELKNEKQEKQYKEKKEEIKQFEKKIEQYEKKIEQFTKIISDIENKLNTKNSLKYKNLFLPTKKIAQSLESYSLIEEEISKLGELTDLLKEKGDDTYKKTTSELANHFKKMKTALSKSSLSNDNINSLYHALRSLNIILTNIDFKSNNKEDDKFKIKLLFIWQGGPCYGAQFLSEKEFTSRYFSLTNSEIKSSVASFVFCAINAFQNNKETKEFTNSIKNAINFNKNDENILKSIKIVFDPLISSRFKKNENNQKIIPEDIEAKNILFHIVKKIQKINILIFNNNLIYSNALSNIAKSKKSYDSFIEMLSEKQENNFSSIKEDNLSMTKSINIKINFLIKLLSFLRDGIILFEQDIYEQENIATNEELLSVFNEFKKSFNDIKEYNKDYFRNEFVSNQDIIGTVNNIIIIIEYFIKNTLEINLAINETQTEVNNFDDSEEVSKTEELKFYLTKFPYNLNREGKILKNKTEEILVSKKNYFTDKIKYKLPINTKTIAFLSFIIRKIDYFIENINKDLVSIFDAQIIKNSLITFLTPYNKIFENLSTLIEKKLFFQKLSSVKENEIYLSKLFDDLSSIVFIDPKIQEEVSDLINSCYKIIYTNESLHFNQESKQELLELNSIIVNRILKDNYNFHFVDLNKCFDFELEYNFTKCSSTSNKEKKSYLLNKVKESYQSIIFRRTTEVLQKLLEENSTKKHEQCITDGELLSFIEEPYVDYDESIDQFKIINQNKFLEPEANNQQIKSYTNLSGTTSDASESALHTSQINKQGSSQQNQSESENFKSIAQTQDYTSRVLRNSPQKNKKIEVFSKAQENEQENEKDKEDKGCDSQNINQCSEAKTRQLGLTDISIIKSQDCNYDDSDCDTVACVKQKDIESTTNLSDIENTIDSLVGTENTADLLIDNDIAKHIE